MQNEKNPVALITGATVRLALEPPASFAGWQLILDAREATALNAAAQLSAQPR
jgi:NADP-dependent 3-hydroxy acid dehydrogenase YdfG